MPNGVINLDSDDESPPRNTSQKVVNDQKLVSERIEIMSDDAEASAVSDAHDSTLLNPKPPQQRQLTSQELLRQKMAEAAERRMKRRVEVDIHDSMDTKPFKRVQRTQIVESYRTKLPPTSINERTSRIRLISNPSYCREFGVKADGDTISFADLVGSPDLTRSYQFNFLIDFDYLAKFVTSSTCEFVLVNKSDDEEHLRISDSMWEKYKIQTVDVSNSLPKFGTHHTKMMVNFYKDGSCQIVLHTMNLTEADHLIQTQMAWVSPALYPHQNLKDYFDFNQPGLDVWKDTGTIFKRDFIAYLMSYKNSDINKLIDKIGKYDFKDIDVMFVASSPGHYLHTEWNDLIKPGAKPMFGYGRLWQVIHMLGLQSLGGKLVGQTSTIAGPCDSWKRNILVHLLTSCAEKGFPMLKKADYEYRPGKNKVEPVIVWPTFDEVLKSKASALSGVCLHLTTHGKWAAYQRHFENTLKYFHKWTTYSDKPSESKAGRSNLTPHVKTYTLTEDNFKTVKWFLLTSANLSHQAWGKSKKFDKIEYDISSFEAGIFVAPELLKVSGNTENKRRVLVPCYGKDNPDDVQFLGDEKFKIGIRLPYDTPLQKYGPNDKPWGQPESDQLLM
ncbi:uncharacterized protein C5L36_0A06350 [Pichia kudriavzevii]|uniref:Tyrosyl-DNA phosphodiesterase 1 n=1 Tax=Pichia kudriavzevii TaxID=4909 RepID=A0A2U9QYD1_PICKU|nr:uncharacterized protein C5L36_0A06350 [Pichia kudriavzevii]AWU74041.1 hypothetical protein C5L36_0A06350 [Pichia kudriavzevii]